MAFTLDDTVGNENFTVIEELSDEESKNFKDSAQKNFPDVLECAHFKISQKIGINVIRGTEFKHVGVLT